jgi:hypothetical protein
MQWRPFASVLDGGELSTSFPCGFTHKKQLQCTLTRRVGQPHNQPGHYVENFPLLETEPWLFSLYIKLSQLCDNHKYA